MVRKYWKWLLSLVLLAGVVAGGLVALRTLNAYSADNYIDGSAWVESVSAQRLPDGEITADKYVDVAPDEHVSAYDSVRFKATFTVPKGTLSADNNKVRFPITGIDFKKSNYPQAGEIYNGSVKYGTLTFDGEANPELRVSGNYAIITFNSRAINDNAVTDLTSGTFQFNVNPAKTLRGSDDHIISIGNGSFSLYIDRAHLTVVKEATDTPKKCFTDHYCFYWTVKVTNDGDIALKDSEMYDCRVKDDSTRGNRVCQYDVLSWSFYPNITENGSITPVRTDNVRWEAGESRTFNVETSLSQTAYADNIANVHNYFAVAGDPDYMNNNSVPEPEGSGEIAIAEDWASQNNPFYRELPDIDVEKARDDHDIEYVNRNTGSTCKYGDEGCTAKVGWTITITNKGESDAHGISLVEQGIGTYWTGAQITEIEKAIKDASGIDATWNTEQSNNDGAILGNIKFNDVVKAKQSFTFTYHNTANVGPNDTDVGKQNCVSAVASNGTILTNKCRGLGFGIEKLEKYAYNFEGASIASTQNFLTAANLSWGIYTSLSKSHVGKTIVLHEQLLPGMKSAFVDRSSSTAAEDKIRCTTSSSCIARMAIPDYTDGWYGSSYFKLIVHRVDETHFDIIVPNARENEAIYVTPIIDRKYLDEHGTVVDKITEGDWEQAVTDKYCKSLTFTNTVTSSIADAVSNADDWYTSYPFKPFKYTIIDGAYEKTASSEPASSTTCSVNAKGGAVSPSSKYLNSGTAINYSISYNSAGFKLNNGNPVTIHDSLSNIPDNASVSLDKSSIKFCTNTSGSYPNDNACYGYSTLTGINVSWDAAHNLIVFSNVPDETSVAIDYTIVFNSPDDKIPSVGNSISVIDNVPNTMKSASYSLDVPISHSGGTATGNMISIQKIGKARYGTDHYLGPLQGAVFTVSAWNGSEWVDGADRITNADGIINLGKLECGTAYRITEKTAPKGFELAEPQEFYLKNCGTDSQKRPDGFQGNAILSGATIQVVDKELAKTTITISKVDANDNTKSLAGSEWEIRKKDGTVVKKLIDEGLNDEYSLSICLNDKNQSFSEDNCRNDTANANGIKPSQMWSLYGYSIPYGYGDGTDGYLQFTMDSSMIGEYDIVETKAPAGYATYEGNDNGKIHLSIRYSDFGNDSLTWYPDEGKGTEDTQHLVRNGSYFIPDEKASDKPVNARIPFNKSFGGNVANWPDGTDITFTATLTSGDASKVNGLDTDNSVSMQVKPNADTMNLWMPYLTFSAEGQYKFTLREVDPHADKWTADSHSYTIVINVNRDKAGALSASVNFDNVSQTQNIIAHPEYAPTFTNTYKQDVFTGFLPMTGRNAVFMVIAVAIMASVVAVLVMRKRD